MSQLALDFGDNNKPTIRDRALIWITRYPNVVCLFERFCQDMVDRNRQFGINLVRERVRWETHFDYDTEYKFCNTYSPYVARYLLWKHPTWAEHMDCRCTQDEEEPTPISDAEVEAAYRKWGHTIP